MAKRASSRRASKKTRKKTQTRSRSARPAKDAVEHSDAGVDITDDRFDPRGIATKWGIRTGPRMMGRPSKISDSVVQALCDHLVAGATVEAAATCVGISPSTFYKWCDRGRKELERIEKAESLNATPIADPVEAEFVDFLHAVELAKALFETRSVRLIANAAQRDWKAALALLERRRSRDYATRVGVDADVRADHTHRLMTDEQRARADEILRRAGLASHITGE